MKKIKKIISFIIVFVLMMSNTEYIVFADNNNKISSEITIEDNGLNDEGTEVIENGTDIKENSTDEKEEAINEKIDNEENKSFDDEKYYLESNNENTKLINEKSLVGEKYEKIIYDLQEVKSIDIFDTEEEKEEYNNKVEAAKSLFKLKTKTSSPYEITLAYSDGSYSYLESADDLNEAIKKADEEYKKYEKDNIIPAVISNEGSIVYATNSMARFYKYINGVPFVGEKVTNIYSNQSLSKGYTYINQNSIDDVPVINTNGKSTQVLVSGFKGWVNSDTSKSEYDLVIVPINQAINPSFYIVKDGILKHFISINLTSSNYPGTYRTIGIAPEGLKEGVEYLSYDGVYFYDGSNTAQGLNTLINDLKANTVKNAVNATKPYYAYYSYLPYRSKTSFSETQLDDYINNFTQSNSKLRGIGQALKNAEVKYGVNAVLMLASAFHESGAGLSPISQSKNNLFGMKVYDENTGAGETYNTVADCIEDFAKNYISRSYADPAGSYYYGGFLGNKNLGANVKYASDPYWGEKIADFALRIDLWLSDSDVNNLKDMSTYNLGMFTTDTTVINKNGTVLYKIKSDNTDLSEYASYAGTTFVINSMIKTIINGEEYYEIYPERDTPINGGGPSNLFSGIYNWNSKAYVKANTVKVIHDFRTDWKDNWASKEIENAMKNGWVNTSNIFRPEDAITRAEFIKIVNNAFGFNEKASSENFSDVNSNDWWYGEVLKAISARYIDINQAKFRPNDKISREEVASIITSIKKNKDSNLDKIKTYSDYKQISSWAQTSVEGAIEAGYMGRGSTSFRPKANITRAEAVVTLYRIVK